MKATNAGESATLIAITCAAYLIATVAHEALGHGGMCLALGGHLNFVSTTYADCTIRSRLIDGAGPITGIVVALVALACSHFARPATIPARLFLLLLFAFGFFWNVFYLIRSGITDQGDWAFVITGLQPSLLWHAVITIVGLAFYALAIRVLAPMIRACASSTGEGYAAYLLTLIVFIAATVLAGIAAQFDRRAVAPDFIDRLPSALSAFGLVWAGSNISRRTPSLRIFVPLSIPWIVAGSLSAILLVAVLGAGVYI